MMTDRVLSRRDMLAGMTAAAAFVPVVVSAAENTQGLRKLADSKGFRFGAAIDSQALDTPELLDLYRINCNSITPRNSLKWSAIEAVPKQFTFDVMDKIVDFAEANAMRVYGHTLIWYRVPSWVERLTDPDAVSRAMQRHITTTMTHYAGRIDAWDVVNEVLEYDKAEMRPSVFYRLRGEDHIREAFEIARAADPKATLVINEAHLEKAGDAYQQRRDMFLKLMERMVAAKAPIQAVGLQSHFRPGADSLDDKGLGDFCAALKSMGIAVYITELDASLRDTKFVRGFDMSMVGDIFKSVVEVADGSGDLRGVTVWGLSEKFSQPEGKKDHPGKKRVNLYDDDDQARPTYAALESALRNIKSSRP